MEFYLYNNLTKIHNKKLFARNNGVSKKKNSLACQRHFLFNLFYHENNLIFMYHDELRI